MEVVIVNNSEVENLKKIIMDLRNQNNHLSNELNIIKHALNKEDMLSFEEENYCPICGKVSVFGPFGTTPRMHAKCLNCGSLERHRLVYLFFQKTYSYLLENENINLLHFAPEPLFYRYFIKNENINYFPVDIDPEGFMRRNIKIKQKVDMQDIPYPDKMFDFIYNSHVLEHIPDDLKGMRELYRVLKEDGVCITLIPQQFTLKTTLENDEYNTPELRRKYYGQEDHVRKYGLDFKYRLESVGFNVEEIRAEDLLYSGEERNLYKLINDVIYVCTK